MRELPNINKPLIFLLDLYLYLFSSSYSVLEKKKKKREKYEDPQEREALTPLVLTRFSSRVSAGTRVPAQPVSVGCASFNPPGIIFFHFLSFSFADLPKPSLSFFAFSLSNLHFFSRVFFICLFAAFRVPLNPKFFYFYRVFSSKYPIRLMGFPHFYYSLLLFCWLRTVRRR